MPASILTLSDSLPTTDTQQTDRILATMKSIEAPAAQAMVNDCDRTLYRLLALAEPLIEQKDIVGIQKLSVGLNVALQRPISQIWEAGFYAGSVEGLAEMKAALPPELLELQGAAQFGVYGDRIKKLVWGLFRMVPRSFRNTGAESAVRRRVLKLAGNYANDVLEEVRSHLIASIVPSSTQGVLSRQELIQKIQGTLGVARRRAETIATTETCAAYNQGRMQVYKESKLVTHLLFMPIDDGRTSDICRSRKGLVFPIGDKTAIAQCQPPCHFRCRSVLSAVMSVAPNYKELTEDPKRMIKNRKLVPLLKGWRVGK